MDVGWTFLTAAWRHLAILNYEADPALLAPLVPEGTFLDDWEGRSYASLVAFLFEDTRVLGVPVPFHRRFEELNLRFYVRREVEGEVRRGVRFVQEIVPRRAVAWLARAAYGENYVARPMRHALERGPGGEVTAARYSFVSSGREQGLGASTAGPYAPMLPGSVEEFVAEHYWGYVPRRGGGTLEYEVEHPPWRIAPAASSACTLDAASVYGAEFAELLAGPPVSAFLAEGSAVAVRWGRRIA